METVKRQRGAELQERPIEFAVAALQVKSTFGNDAIRFHLGRQLIRSANSPALNYAESLGAESRKDFIHKLKICLKELRESSVGLNILSKVGRIPCDQPIHSECNQLIAIITSSIKTATRNMKSTN